MFVGDGSMFDGNGGWVIYAAGEVTDDQFDAMRRKLGHQA